MNLKQLPRWLRDHYLAVGLLMFSSLGQSLFAATIIVNSLEDTTLADGQCTLREALENANQDTAEVGDCIAGNGDDVIDLTGLNGTITLSSELRITSNLIVEGPGAEKLTLSGNHQAIIFDIAPDPEASGAITVKINGIKITKGYSNWNWYGYCGGISAGSINGSSHLTISDSIISGNSSGGITNCDGTHIINSVVSGNGRVGIYSENDLTITGSTVSKNRDGGIITYGITNIANSTISENDYDSGITSEGGTLTITSSTISGNSAYGDGGGISTWNNNLTITDSVVSENFADGNGGGIYHHSDNNATLIIKNSTISENLAHEEGGTSNGGGIYHYGDSNATVIIENSTILGNSAYKNGGGISSRGAATITSSTISENSADYSGGGINSDGALTLTNSTVSGNSGDYSGGGINSGGTLTLINSAVLGNSVYEEEGGGISSRGTAVIISSTISGNSSNYSGGGINSGGALILSNSTVSGNSVVYAGGGVYSDGSTITITNSTISENNVAVDDPDDSRDGGGGIYNEGTLNLKNTLIANNINGDCYNYEWSTIDTNLNNFIGDGSCDPTFSGDPKLGPLANNGGPTFTHALRRGSPAIDVGDDTICAAEPVNGLDQRGVARFGSLAGNHCDIGAYEYQKPALATLGSFTIESDAIRWETLAEQGTQGFYLWQAEPVIAGTCEAVTNPQLVISKPISAKGSEIQGETYQAAVAVNLNGCYGIQEIPSGQIYITPRPGRNEWTGEQWLTR
jgi:CSLREA domain-containing protein